MTKEEHIARAMLLGMRYRPERGWYTTAFPNSIPHVIHRLDAITLEVITEEERERRSSTWQEADWYEHD